MEKNDMVVGVAIEDSVPDPDNPGEHIVKIRIWSPAQLNPPERVKAIWLWAAFLCGMVIGATVVGFTFCS